MWPFGRRASDRDIERELHGYLRLLVEEKMRAGHSEGAARREALVELGGLQQVKEQVRDSQRGRRIEQVLLDARYAVRALRHQPAFSLTVVLVLALGIGANATMFGIVDRILLRPPPEVASPERVVTLSYDRKNSSQEFIAYPMYTAMRDARAAFTAVAAYRIGTISVGLGADARSLHSMKVTGDFFSLLGVRPVLGRFFGPDAEGASPPSVVVISELMWDREYARDPGAIGRELHVGDVRYTIIGVAPAGFRGLAPSAIDVWLPFFAGDPPQAVASRSHDVDTYWLQAVARLADGVTPEGAGPLATPALLAAERAGGRPERQIAEQAMRVGAVSILPREALANDPDARVAILLGIVSGLVLLIACANVGGLQVARALRRQREMALRVALGATGRRLVGQLVTEGLLLSLVAGTVALGVAFIGGRLARSVLFTSNDWELSIVDGRLLSFTLAASIVAGILIGILPVMHARNIELTSAIKGGARDGRSRSQARTVLLVVQTALTAVLLVGTGLFVRSLRAVSDLPLGFESQKVLVGDLRTSGVKLSRDQLFDLYERLRLAGKSSPEVERAALATSLPFYGTWATNVSVPGRDSLPRVEDGGPYFIAATDEYFETMGMQILRGRAYRSGGPREVVINESMARLWWPRENPIGRCLKVGGNTMPCSQIVGIVANPRRQNVIEDRSLQFFVPLEQAPDWVSSRVLVMRPRLAPASVSERLRAALQRSDAGLPYLRLQPMNALIAPQTRSWELGAKMFAAFGLLSLVLASVGLYGTLSYDVSQRSRELGIRAALGAGASAIASTVIGHGLRVMLAGIGLGLVAAAVAGERVRQMLFATSPYDAATFVVVALALLVVSALAMVVPTVRATRVDPLRILKSD